MSWRCLIAPSPRPKAAPHDPPHYMGHPPRPPRLHPSRMLVLRHRLFCNVLSHGRCAWGVGMTEIELMPDDLDKWRRMLAGEKVPMHLDEPIIGYFKIRDRRGLNAQLAPIKRPWIACAIWRG